MSTTTLRIILGFLVTLCLALPASAFADVTSDSSSLGANDVTTTQYQMTLPGGEALGDDVFLQTSQDRTRALVVSQALTGGLVGTLLGLGGYVISGFDWTPWSIPIFAASGAVAGGLIGWAISRMDETPLASSVEYMQRDTPRAVQVRVFHLTY